MNEQFKKDLGYKLLVMRTQRKMSQREVGEKLGEINKDLFVLQATVSSWEKGRTEPSIKHMQGLCKIFNCTLSDFVGDQEEDTDKQYEITVSSEEYTLIETLRQEPELMRSISLLLRLNRYEDLIEGYKGNL